MVALIEEAVTHLREARKARAATEKARTAAELSHKEAQRVESSAWRDLMQIILPDEPEEAAW